MAVIYITATLNFAKAQLHADFIAATEGCLQENIKLTDQSTGATHLEWDLCQGDLASTPTGTGVLTMTGDITTGIDIVFDGTNWFGFVANQNGSSILRLDFGTNVSNTPTITDLGNISGLTNRPTDIKIIYDNGQWYGFVYCLANPKISRIDFGNSLTNTTTSGNAISANAIVAGAGQTNGGFDMMFDGANWILVMTNNTTFDILKFNSVNSIPSAPEIIAAAPNGFANGMGDVALAKDGDNYFAFVVAFGNKTLQKLSFGNALFSVPAVVDISTVLPPGPTPYGIDIAFDNGNFYSVIATLEGNLIRLDHGPDLSLPPVGATPLGTLSTLENTLKTRLIKSGTSWFAFLTSWSSRRLFRTEFINPNCEFNVMTENDPVVKFEQSGEKAITLRAFNDDGVFSEKSALINITTNTAPSLNIEVDNICTENPSVFTVTSSLPLASQVWDFGDGNSSPDLQPAHGYTSEGNYTVLITVTATNACSNFFAKGFSIYELPQTSFSFPPGLLCTNSDVLFTNDTPDNFDNTHSYQWMVDGEEVSIQRDLTYVFETGGVKEISLNVSNPGCNAVNSQFTPEILIGASIDFSVTGHCEDQAIQFETKTSDVLSQHSWNFDDGSGSVAVDPQHIFSSAGIYSVSLTAQSANGCNNTRIKQVPVFYLAYPDFSAEGPPSLCIDYPSQFSDLTPALPLGNLESWHWNFDDGGTSGEQNPAHIFQAAGEHNVQLTVTSDDGCSNTIVKPVTILQSPTISFENGPACLAKPTILTATSNDAVQYHWEIGTAYYEAQNTAHVFNTPGSHTVKLNVLGSNDCISEISQQVNVPIPFDPVFSVTNNCKDFETRFTTSFSSADPVVARNWNFAGEGSSTEGNPSHTFTSTGNKLVTLQVTTASGCIYQRQNTVNVLGAPISSFTFTPGFGVPPQEISFVNSSSNASSFKWDFGDGNSSTANSPKHTFTALGDYEVKLTATNDAACQVASSQVVPMVAPLPDVDLSLMTITPNDDGTSKIIVTIANNGNTFLKNLPIRLDVSGNVTLETIVNETIAPFSMYNLVLEFGIAQTQALEFLCASTTLEGDLHPEGNRICNQLKSETAILSPYPNPADDVLTVEWVAQEGEEVEVKLVDTDGKSVINFREVSSTGLNQRLLDISRLRAGIYILRIVSPTHAKTHRILVSTQN